MGYYDPNTTAWVDYEIPVGTTIDIDFQPDASSPTIIPFTKSYVSQAQYTNFEEWFNAEANLPGSYSTNFVRRIFDNGLELEVTVAAAQPPARRSLTGTINVSTSSGQLILETLPETIKDEFFYETAETFEIINGFHQGNFQNQDQFLPATLFVAFYNCYAYPNGVESYQYLDSVVGNFLNVDYRPSAVTQERYRAVRRASELTYGGNFQPSTGINQLNEFNLATANFKEDIDLKWGSIQKIYSRNTNLVVFQEDKVHQVLFGKDLLVNADGTSNVTSTNQVLGQHVPFAGEFGISFNPESMCTNGNYIYFADAKRGYYLRLAGDGITKISEYGMRTYFRDLYKEGLYTKRVCEFDPYFDQVVVGQSDDFIANSYGVSAPSLANSEETLVFDDRSEIKGWTTFLSYVPDMMVGINNRFFSWFQGGFWEHHIGNVNEFYALFTPSSVEVVLNEAVSDDKIFKTVVLEGSKEWQVDVETNFASGVVFPEEFIQKESRFFAYIRGNEAEVDTSYLNASGLGTITGVNSLIVSVSYIGDEVSAGDRLYRNDSPDPEFLGNITGVNRANLEIFIDTPIPSVAVIGSLGFALKNSRIESESIRGYYMKATLTQTSQEAVELFAVNSNAVKTYV